MPYKLNNILFRNYGIVPGRCKGEGIAIKGIFDMPKRIGDVSHSWAESDSVEAYVDEDEIFLGGRDILFTGIIKGTKSEVKTNLDQLKSDIDAFTDVVPLETPYGNACVQVKDIRVSSYKTLSIISILFREPEIGASCGLNTPETTYYSAEYSEDAQKNDCDSGYHGSTETLTSVAGRFTSTVSQAAADLLAVSWVQANKQAYANTNGTCIINPPIYWSAPKSGQLQKNDCGFGYVGSVVAYEVPAGAYNSLVSQEDADAQAQAELDANLTQQYANDNGSCLFEGYSTIREIWNEVLGHGTQEGYRVQRFEIGSGLKVGSIFKIICYGVEQTYTVQEGDTVDVVAWALVNLINNTPSSLWRSLFMAPPGGTYAYPPDATHLPINKFEVVLNWQNQIYATVDNDV